MKIQSLEEKIETQTSLRMEVRRIIISHPLFAQ